VWRINISKVSNNKRSYIELETVTKRESLYIDEKIEKEKKN
jgi:hypothetical protein